jgi:hypothetical protein
MSVSVDTLSYDTRLQVSNTRLRVPNTRSRVNNLVPHCMRMKNIRR